MEKCYRPEGAAREEGIRKGAQGNESGSARRSEEERTPRVGGTPLYHEGVLDSEFFNPLNNSVHGSVHACVRACGRK